MADFSYADNAEVIPKGVTRTRLEAKFYSTVDEKYDENGDAKPIADEYNTSLDSGVFPALSLVEQAFPAFLNPGEGNVGDSVVSFEYEFDIYEFFVEHGLTDRLSIGIKIPYWDVKTNANARNDTTNATVGKTSIGAGIGAPLAPLAGPFPDTVPLTTDDVQNVLGDGLDVNGDGTTDVPGFGYKPVENWSNDGISDIEAGLKLQYLKTENWRLAFLGGVRIPTGDTDDPDSLVDYPLGKGNWAFLFYFNQDYIGIENLVLNATVEYELMLPYHSTRRVYSDPNLPLTSIKEDVKTDPGDRIEFNTSASYTFAKGFSLYLYYENAWHWKDNVTGYHGRNYKILEEETNYREQVYRVGLYYSTIPLYQQKKFPVPLTTTIQYRKRFAGKNNLLKSDYILLGLHLYF
jgi:hypothetical protein